MSDVFGTSYGSLRVIEFSIFSIWQRVKSYGCRKLVKKHKLRTLKVPNHRSAHRQFWIMVVASSI